MRGGGRVLEDTSIAGSDDWWVMRLGEKLGSGLFRMSNLTQYRNGDALLPDNAWNQGTRESYMRFMKRSRLHIVETLRDSRTDRQRVMGFRTAALDDAEGDVEAWKRWKRNRMKVQSRSFFNDTGDYGASHLLIVPSEQHGPIWNVRNDWNTVTEPNSLRPWLTEAGLTYGFDQVLGYEVLTLHRPGYFRQAVRPSRMSTLPQDGSGWYPGAGWSWATGRVRVATEDALLQTYKTLDGYGIYEKHLDTIDRINEITLNALTLIIMQSFRQRGVKGNLPEYYPEGHPLAGQRIDYDEMFQAGPAALWMLPLGADIWESQPTDVRPIYEARKDEIKVLSSLTRTPQDIFDGSSQNQSALGAQVSREPLIHAVNNMNDLAEVTLTHAMSLDFQLSGDAQRAAVEDLEVIWAKPNPATLAEKAEAASKYKAGGATQHIIDSEVFELTPAQQREAKADRVAEAFVNSLGQAPTVGQVTEDAGD